MVEHISLHEAIRIGYFEKVIELISLGNDINDIDGFNQTVLHVGINHKQTDIVRFLLYIQNDPTILHNISKSLQFEDFDITRSLNSKDIYRNTPLVIAVNKNNREITKILLEMGSDVNVNMEHVVNDKKWQTKYPLMIAVLCSHYEIFEMLMNYGANPFTVDKNGNTLLYYASERGCIKMVHRLINCGLDVNTINKLGETPLHIASKNNYTHIVQLLLSHRVIMLNDINNKSPIYYSIRNENYDIINLIRDYLHFNIKNESIQSMRIIQNIRKSTRMKLYLQFQSRLPYLKLCISCYGNNQNHIGRYLFDILVQKEICSFIPEELYY
jgi:ankyrin repeat protein